jgi:hypothetical protein
MFNLLLGYPCLATQIPASGFLPSALGGFASSPCHPDH